MTRLACSMIVGCLLALAAAGCGSPTAVVSGTVTFKGHPLPSGTILFHGSDGRVEHGLIGSNGVYTLTNAPPGPVRISVKSHPASPTGMPSRGGPPPAAPTDLSPAVKEQRDGKFVSIPARYLDPQRSGLTYTVRPGIQTHDINLLP